MAVTRITLQNFRSYSEAEFALHPGVTIVVGPNASGKTNLLEALYVLSTTRSFRASDRELVADGQTYFRIAADEGDDALALGLTTEGGKHKQVTHNEVKRTLARHLGRLPVVLFEPNDMNLVSGPPDQRRRYLDLLLSQTDANYLVALHKYRRVLQQRNKLLDSFDIESVRGQIFAWDLKLAESAAQLFEGRQRIINFLDEMLSKTYSEIAGHQPELRVQYVASVSPDDYQNSFLATLAQNLPRDLGAGFTTIGPHREDFTISFNGNEMSSVASRGETRTAVLAFKLAELAYQEQLTGQSPLFLLDDVFSELDSSRRSRLINLLGGHQTIITTTDADAVLRAVTQPHGVIRTKLSSEQSIKSKVHKVVKPPVESRSSKQEGRPSPSLRGVQTTKQSHDQDSRLRENDKERSPRLKPRDDDSSVIPESTVRKTHSTSGISSRKKKTGAANG